MRELSEILKHLSDVDTSTTADAQYWMDANQNLAKGWTLSVGTQNVLDDINASFAEQFKKHEIDVTKLDQLKFQELLARVDLSPLGKFVTANGIDHHYHVNTGIGDRNFHLKIDLKCIPTVKDQLGNPVAALCFIAAQIQIGTKTIPGVLFKYIGPENLAGQHRLGVRHAMIATNSELGAWLRYVRSMTHDEHLLLLEYEYQIQ